MFRFWLSSLCCLSCAALSGIATAVAEDPNTSDQTFIQGTWECVETIKDGQSVRDYVGVRAIIEGNRLTWMFLKSDGTRVADFATFRIDPSQNPKHFDWTYDRKPDDVHRRLYVLEGDTLKWYDNLTGIRPKTFEEAKWQFIMKRVAADQMKFAQQIEGWGTVVDPLGDGTATKANGAVELSVPGTYHDLWPAGRVNAPRILRPVRGDFTVQVKITGKLNTAGKTVAADVPANVRAPFQAATLLVWLDENNFVRLERASSMSTNTRHFWYYHTFDRGQRVVHRLGDLNPHAATQLWIARKQGTFYAYYRQDGQSQWTALETHRLGLPDEVQVGVSLVNSSSEPFTARFEDFKVGRAE